ncbi:hypothetical protein PHYBLDRAFT_164706 [Phycomyces blakesleeanus NRRL 1555(-)]|uniref:Uncharacterized protein n=1 Tax=Phycomyces blakesleeanus (strain ATCC 8743b / DSM 1359 / FGSC 10004 / NBRC 33097 / NRRL 1555) TaxID=763407 RepID=A0A167PFM2_PHYB8|nr:hypothetical protein PHYBLDRAFT_164706 [Phycomyces blakesleeanus NRRL 1555(-)]OAD77818.1 hypothetical protein PHYBLDRAFT_164706 [Phycomyces blakesleeanus NRRL 1555(-)]|eukprot:XP_018295858.1 hypothetical protein PHYBLDRAFT_164706 [Phycomyces blakesleeanus NRRL 1555(-)]
MYLHSNTSNWSLGKIFLALPVLAKSKKAQETTHTFTIGHLNSLLKWYKFPKFQGSRIFESKKLDISINIRVILNVQPINTLYISSTAKMNTEAYIVSRQVAVQKHKPC